MESDYRSFLTLAKPATAEIKEKGSRFISFVYPVTTEDEIKNYLKELKESYPDATHHCFAWILGNDGNQERANDDGEPSNSAGRPILRQLYSFEICNVLAVVVRYYGGTKLGVSGLIQAYGGATKAALDVSDIIEVLPSFRYKINYEYLDEGLAFRLIRQLNAEPENIERLEKGSVYFQIPAEKIEELERLKSEYYQLEIEELK